MASEVTRALSFGADAKAYDAYRPGYPARLFDELWLLADRANPKVVEIGAGTGQATSDFASRGASVVALEPDARLVTILVEKSLPNVEVVPSTFERWEAPEWPFDIVASAQAWHWVDQDVGADKAASTLRSGGLLALWWNMPSSERSTGSHLLDSIYEEVAPELLDTSVMARATSDGRHTRRVEESPMFEPPYQNEYQWSQSYSADAYVSLLATHSDHRTMPPDRRESLLNAIHAAISSAGGIEFLYVTELFIARRR